MFMCDNVISNVLIARIDKKIIFSQSNVKLFCKLYFSSESENLLGFALYNHSEVEICITLSRKRMR